MAIGAIALGVTIGACGGDDDDESGQPAASSSGELAIYDWEASVIPRRGVGDPFTNGYSSEPETPAGAVVVRAEDTLEGTQYFVLRNEPFVTEEDVVDPEVGFDPTGVPSVVFQLTDAGKRDFREGTAAIAARGRKQGKPNHFAVIVDGERISLPQIDFRELPNGVDPSTGVQIAGGFTEEEAEELVEQLGG
jgi:preprotein translocase subunit SecD